MAALLDEQGKPLLRPLPTLEAAPDVSTVRTSAPAPKPVAVEPPQPSYRKWDEIEQDEAFKALPSREQEAARQEYFTTVVAPQLGDDEVMPAKKEFDQLTRSSTLGRAAHDAKRTLDVAADVAGPVIDQGLSAIGRGVKQASETLANPPPVQRLSPPAKMAQQGVSGTSQYDPFIEEAAKTYQVPAADLRAMLNVESSGNPNATSSKGAQGLMQLMPGTAAEMGVTDPSDPRQNILGGARYYRKMLDRYKGNRELAIAAYNAGPGTVDKAGGVPNIAETRNHVAKVMGRAAADQGVNTEIASGHFPGDAHDHTGELMPFLLDGKNAAHVRGLNSAFQGRLAAMLKDAPAGVQIMSGYRSPERQTELWQAALAKYGSPEAARKWVAPPGHSNHNHGIASDLTFANDQAKQWVHENAKKYGLNFRMAHEGWHIEPVEAHGDDADWAKRFGVQRDPTAQDVPKELYGLALKPGYVDTVRARYDAASPAERAAMISGNDVESRVARYVDDGYRKATSVTDLNAELAGFGTRREDRTNSYLDQGFDRKTANQLANEDLLLGRDTQRLKESERPSLLDQVKTDWQRGVLNTQAMGAGLGAWALDVAGNEEKASELLRDYQDLTQEAAQYAPVIGDFDKIGEQGLAKVPEDVARYMTEAIVGNLPNFLPSLALGGVGGMAARRATQGIVNNLIEKLGAAKAAKFVAAKTAQAAQGFGRIGATAEAIQAKGAAELAQQGVTAALKNQATKTAMGAAVGAGAASVGMETGSIYGDIYDQTGQRRPGVAGAAGLAAGALDAIPAMRAATKLVGPVVTEAVAGTVMSRLGKEAGIQFLSESGTEFMQTLVENGAVHVVEGKPLVNEQDIHEALNAALQGGIAGSATGVATQGLGEVRGAMDREPSKAAQIGVALQSQVDRVRAGINDDAVARDRLDPNRAGQPNQSPAAMAARGVTPKSEPIQPRELPAWSAQLPQESGREQAQPVGPGLTGAAGSADRADGGADLLSFAPDYRGQRGGRDESPAGTGNGDASAEVSRDIQPTEPEPGRDAGGLSERESGSGGAAGAAESDIAVGDTDAADVVQPKKPKPISETPDVPKGWDKAITRVWQEWDSNKAARARLTKAAGLTGIKLGSPARSITSRHWEDLPVNLQRALAKLYFEPENQNEKTPVSMAPSGSAPDFTAGMEPVPSVPDEGEPVSPAPIREKAPSADKNPEGNRQEPLTGGVEAEGLNWVEHTTAKGKTIRGIVRKDLTVQQAKEIDPFTFRKDGGFFIREKHVLAEQRDGVAVQDRKFITPRIRQAYADYLAAGGEDTHFGTDGKGSYSIEDSAVHDGLVEFSNTSTSGNARSAGGQKVFENRLFFRKSDLDALVKDAKAPAQTESGHIVDANKKPAKPETKPAMTPQQAFDAGARAYQNGDRRQVPQEVYDAGHAVKWFSGWDKANLAAPMDDKPQASPDADKLTIEPPHERERKRRYKVRRGEVLQATFQIGRNGQPQNVEMFTFGEPQQREIHKAIGQFMEQRKADIDRRWSGADKPAATEAPPAADSRDDTETTFGMKEAPTPEESSAVEALWNRVNDERPIKPLAVLRQKYPEHFLHQLLENASGAMRWKSQDPKKRLPRNNVHVRSTFEHTEKAIKMLRSPDIVTVHDGGVSYVEEHQNGGKTLHQIELRDEAGWREQQVMWAAQRPATATPPVVNESLTTAPAPEESSATVKESLTVETPGTTPGAAPVTPEAQVAAEEMADLKAQMGQAIGELAALLGAKSNLTEEEETRLIPIMSKIFRIAAKMGYIQFKESARHVMQQIRELAGNEIADKLSIDNLQAGYINIASEIGGDKKAALGFESIDELMAESAPDKANNLDNTSTAPVEKRRVSKLKGTDNAARTDETGGLPTGDTQGSPGGQLDSAGDRQSLDTGLAGSGQETDRDGRVPAGTAESGGTGSRRTGGKRGQLVESDRESATGRTQPGVPDRGDVDHVIETADEVGKGGLTAKYRDNVKAIQLIKALEAENRSATPAERKQLAKYVGWGALKGVFDPQNKTWAKQHKELRALLNDDEWASARASILNAHYTSPAVVQGIYDGLGRLGFSGGRLLEPAMGSGNFFGLMPANVRQASQLHGVELDNLTSRLAKALYPTAIISASTGFQEYSVPSDYFDLAIGNPPFGNEKIVDRQRSPYSGFSIHNYFLARMLDKVREGGIVAAVVSHNFMDVPKSPAREWMAERANLLGAVRLPNTAFKGNAGTEVVTDILFFQKTATPEQNPAWVNASSLTLQDKDGNPAEVNVNDYFLGNPKNILGRQTATGTMYRAGEYNVEPNGDLSEQLKSFMKSLPTNAYESVERTAEELNTADNTVPDGVKQGSFYVAPNGQVRQRGNDVAGQTVSSGWPAPNAKAEQRMKGMIELRELLKAQLRMERDPEATERDIEANRAKLKQAYTQFQKTHGYLNNPTNRRIFNYDTEAPLVQALEFDYDKGVSKAVAEKEGREPSPEKADEADILNRRVLFPPQEAINVSSAQDALLSSLNLKGRIDMDFLSEVYGKPESEIIRELGDSIFRDPLGEAWQTADEYLAGDVKTKLEQAKQAAEGDAAYRRNVEALEKVIPKDRLPSEIYAGLGAGWIPSADVEAFAREISGMNDAKVQYMAPTANWLTSFDGSGNRELMVNEFGTERMNSLAILAQLLNGKPVEVKDRVSDPSTSSGYRLVTNESETEKAKTKADKIKSLWDGWLFGDPERAERLAALFNDKFNRTVTRGFDGSHLSLPGITPVISLRQHQKDVIWRGIQERNILLDHVVGAGKTYAAVATVMEMKRLGISRKPLLTVPNHLTQQWKSDFARLYPAANVLAAEPEDFAKGNRERLFSKIATGDWDAVIVGHSSLKKIGLDPEIEARFLNQQQAEIAEAIEEMKRERGDRNIIRDMEKIKANLDAKITDLVNKAGERDKVLSFNELGIDGLVVDEHHEFKNLFFTTQKQRVSGLGNPKGSGKAFDLFFKIRWLQEVLGEKAPLITATGTPVSNSLAEMFTMQRYMRYDELKRQGSHLFDAWANLYGSDEYVYEVAPSGVGYRISQRFAKFKNLPSLMGQYQQFADTVTLQDLKDQAARRNERFPVPKIEGGRPQNIVAERSALQRNFFGVPEIVKNEAGETQYELQDPAAASIEQNAEGKFVLTAPGLMQLYGTKEEAELGLVSKALTPQVTLDPKSIVGQFENLSQLTRQSNGKINALSLTGLASKAGLDMRLIDPNAPDNPGSKINLAVSQMMRLYKQWNKDKGTQLVFCDLSVPASARKAAASQEKRVYVRDEKGQLTHKKGTLHAVEGREGMPFYLVQTGKGDKRSVTVYEAVTGQAVKSGLASKAEAMSFMTEQLDKETNRDKWFELRERVGAITDEDMAEYRDANEIETDGEDEITLDDLEASSGSAKFSVYDDIKAKLIQKGVPEHEIAFIHDYHTPKKKAELFKRMNRGEVRFLLGSTPKLGAGTNVQQKLVGLHHIDAPWRPSDLEQREGRIIRQGNKLYERDPDGFEVFIGRYATEQTYDTRRWQIIEHKAAGIEQLRRYSGELEIEDVGGEAANAADMKAAASGNPLILEETRLRNEVKRLTALQKADMDSKTRAQSQKRRAIRALEESIPEQEREYQTLIDATLPLPKDSKQVAGFAIDGQRTAVREAAIEAINQKVTALRKKPGRAEIGYRGLTFEIETDLLGSVALFNPLGHRMGGWDLTEAVSGTGLLTRMNNYVEALPSRLKELAARRKKEQADIDLADKVMTTPFAEAGELEQSRARHAEVQRGLMKSSVMDAVPADERAAFEKEREGRKAALVKQGYGAAVEKLEGESPKFSRAALMAGGSDQSPIVQADDQTAADSLNRGMVRYFGDKSWENAYVQVELPDALSGFREAIAVGFGRELVGVFGRTRGSRAINGINYQGKLYLNVNADVGFVQLGGHELLHQLKRDRPDLYRWFAGQARVYYKNLSAYQDKLNALLKPGENPYSKAAAEEELLADFAGDAFADPAFVERLAKADPSRFRQLLNAVIRWLKQVGDKLSGKGLGSSEYFTDVEALRNYLADALVAYGRGGPVAIRKVEGPKFSSSRDGGTSDTQLQKEYEDTKARYEGTDQWMKAPNGQPSNLNERQWVMVRTPRFKAWFGNWQFDADAPVGLVKVVAPQDMPSTDNLQELRNWIRKHFQGSPVRNADTNQYIGIFGDGIKASLKNRNPKARLAYAALPEMLQKAVYVSYEPNTKSDKERRGILGYEMYAVALEIEGVRYPARIKVDLMSPDIRGSGYYYHQVDEIELGEPVVIPGDLAESSAVLHDSPNPVYRLGQLIGEIKPQASKVLDENGEPLVVYHGADEKRTTFDARYGSYFAADKGRAKGYAEARTGWTGEGELTEAFLNIRNPQMFDADNDADFIAFTDQRDPSEAIAEKGYDGQILDFPGSLADNDYRVNSPEQAKSVDNSGAFSADASDIRFSRRSDLNDYPDEREGSGIEEDPEALFADIDDAIRKGGGWDEAKGELEKRWNKLNASARRQWLGALTVHQLVELGGKVLPRMERYLKEMTGMDVTRNRVLYEVDAIAKDWEKLDKQTLGRLAHVMHESTLAGVDGAEDYVPSIDKKDAIKQIGILKRRMLSVPGDDKWPMLAEIRTLKKKIRFEERRKQAYDGIQRMFQALPKDAKDVYVRSRDYHVDQSKRVEQALVEMIEKTQMSGKQRAAAVQKLRTEFEAQRVNAPYFPLSRKGDYWVYIAPPKNSESKAPAEFHMFQTLEEQTAFIQESKAAGMEVLGRGKQLENLQETIGVPGSFVAQVEDIIGQLGEGHPLVESVRDQVYQLYLQTLPDLSARKHFIHRKKTPGFGRDALRAFAAKGYHDAYQYARVKHGFEMRSIMEKLREDLEVAGSKPKMKALKAKRDLLEEFRDEVLNAGMGYQAVKERAEGLSIQEMETRAQAGKRRLGEGEQFVADEAKKWNQFLAWMDEWKRYGGIPDRVNQEIEDIDLRIRTSRLINTRERGYEFGADVYNELQAAYAWLMNPKTAPWATALNQMGYLYNLAFSPSAWVTNATQNPLVAMPYVAAKYGIKNTTAAFGEAYQEAFRGALSKSAHKEHALGIRESLSKPDEIQAYDWALEAGIIERGRAMDLAGTAEEGQDRSAWHRKFSMAMTVGFHDVERLNRETSFIAAYRLARKAGQDFGAAVDYAGEVVNKTHLVYASENRPRFMRSDVARVLLQFKLYSQGITYLLGKAVVDAVGKNASAEEKAEAKRFLAFQFGMQATAAGALGLPIGLAWWAAQAAFGALFDDDDDPKELEPEFRKALAEALGTTGGEAVAKGLVNALLPIDLHSRIGMRELWFRESDREAEGKDAASRMMSSLMGPMAGILENLFVGSQMVSEGHVYRGIEKMMPKFIRDPLKALRYESEGVQTLKGDPLIDDLSTGEFLGQLLGFSPSRLNERYDENNAEKNRQRRIEERRQKLTGDLAQSRIDGVMAQRQGDDRKLSKAQTLFDEAMANAKRFNEKQPGFAIGGKTVGRSIQSRVRARAMARDGIFLNRKIPERYDYATPSEDVE